MLFKKPYGLMSAEILKNEIFQGKDVEVEGDKVFVADMGGEENKIFNTLEEARKEIEKAVMSAYSEQIKYSCVFFVPVCEEVYDNFVVKDNTTFELQPNMPPVYYRQEGRYRIDDYRYIFSVVDMAGLIAFFEALLKFNEGHPMVVAAPEMEPTVVVKVDDTYEHYKEANGGTIEI